MNFAAQLAQVTVVDAQDNVPLDDVSLVVMPGEALAICGHAGGGKTTVLRLLAGLLQPTFGKVLVGGRDVGRLGYEEMRAHRRRVGLAFEQGGFWSNRSLFENIALPLLYHAPESADLEKRVREIAAEVGIDEALDRPAQQAAGSIKKRALVARALLGEPDLLLCDEPQRGLMPREARRLSEAIERRKKGRQMTVVYADHDGHLDPFVCDRRLFLEFGRHVERPSMVISDKFFNELDLGLPRDSLDGGSPVGDAS